MDSDGLGRGMHNPLAPAAGVAQAAVEALVAHIAPAPHAAVEALVAHVALAAPAALVPNNPRILERIAVLALQEMDRRNGVNRVLAETDRLTIASLIGDDLDNLIDFIVNAGDFVDLVVERNLLVAFLLE